MYQKAECGSQPWDQKGEEKWAAPSYLSLLTALCSFTHSMLLDGWLALLQHLVGLNAPTLMYTLMFWGFCSEFLIAKPWGILRVTEVTV